MRVEKNELIEMIDRARYIYIVSNAALFDAFIQIERNVIREFVEHHYNADSGMNISISKNDLYIEKLEKK